MYRNSEVYTQALLLIMDESYFKKTKLNLATKTVKLRSRMLAMQNEYPS
jgi:hypothetical protein